MELGFFMFIRWIVVVLLSWSCRENVQNGSIEKDFTGLESIEILSPSKVKIKWILHKKYRDYQVYYNLSSQSILNTSFSEAIIGDLTPGQIYTFKVVAVDGSVTVGGSYQVAVTMPQAFTGIQDAMLDSNGHVVVTWNYSGPVAEYQLFYKANTTPNAANTNNWNVPDAVSGEQRNVFRNLAGSTRYHIMVHAKYLDDSIERTTIVKQISTNSNFPNPSFTLSPITIGTLPFLTVDPVENAQFNLSSYTSQVFLNNAPISDPLVGRGNINFSSNLGLPLGSLEGLELRVNYNNGSINETRVYDGLSTYIKGLSPLIEKPAISLIAPGAGYMGEALAHGDFNCDGAPDLAIGLPRSSVASVGVKDVRAGAIHIYYSFKDSDDRFKLKLSPSPLRNPAVPGQDPQLITFEDLTEEALFGKSLSGQGNLNGDKFLGKECQDLLVGAPGYRRSRTRTLKDGAAFVFFGSPAGLNAPSRVADLQQNIATCNGVLDGSACSAVMLWPDMRLIPAPLYDTSKIRSDHGAEFGFSVSFIGDFNADGYDDLAIGAPKMDWDGIARAEAPGQAKYESHVGAVTLYFGSPYGLKKERAGVEARDLPFIKIYSPMPHSGAQFGYSVHGGPDVDGRQRYRSSTSGPYVGGSDLIIGSPGFRYPTWGASMKLWSSSRSACVNSMSASVNCPIVGFSSIDEFDRGYNFLNPTQLDNLSATAGAAFLYFGISASATNQVLDSASDKQNFYQCSSRGAGSAVGDVYPDHFSCFAGAQTVGGDNGKHGYRVLFPRSTHPFSYESRAFGTSVVLAGSASRYDANGVLITNNALFTDPNRDGFAEAVVGVGYLNNKAVSPQRSETGGLWVFYGNTNRLYERAFFGINNGYASAQSTDWRLGFGGQPCDNFADTSVATRTKCSPSLLVSNSINAYARMGLYPEALKAADITGDGVQDIIVGVTGDNTYGANAGGVYAFTSAAGQGISNTFFTYYNNQSQAGDQFGRSVAAADFDGDVRTNLPNYQDIVAGAFQDRSIKDGGGAVFGFYSKGQALSSIINVPDFKLIDSLTALQDFGLDASRIILDINGDGFDDAVSKISRASATTTGKVTDAIIYYGSSIGLITTEFCLQNLNRVFKSGYASSSYCYPSVNPTLGVTQLDIQLPQLIIRPLSLTEAWAYQGFSAGDVNGDGFHDIAFLDNTRNNGNLVIYFGSRGGLQAVNAPQWIPALGDPQIITRSLVLPFNQELETVSRDYTNSRYSEQVIFGDFNGDQRSDIVLLNATAESFWRMNKNDSGVTSSLLPLASYALNNVAAGGGWECGAVSGGDALPECINGLPATGMGRVYIFYGSSAGIQTSLLLGATSEPTVNFVNPSAHQNFLVDIYGSEENNGLITAQAPCTEGGSSCRVQYAYSPMIANVPYGHSSMRHFFGASAVAMDRDGDGRDELLIGAPGWEDIDCYFQPSNDTTPVASRPRMNYGRVFIYRGSERGLVAPARTDFYKATADPGSCTSNTLHGSSVQDPGLNHASASVPIRAIMPPLLTTQQDRQFGVRLASADFNGDQKLDLVISAAFESPPAGATNQGVIYTFYGPICKTDNDSTLWGNFQADPNNQLNKQQTFANFSLSPGQDCQNKLLAPHVFYVKDGLADENAGLTLTTGPRRVRGYSSSTFYSDFNGDGYDDILVGIPFWTDSINSNPLLGRGIVFFGSQYGLYTNDFANQTVLRASVQAPGSSILVEVVRPYTFTRYEGEISPHYFRYNTSAGDVNGDGTVDYMITTKEHDGYDFLRGINVGTFFMFY
jgi:large repetitive protein